GVKWDSKEVVRRLYQEAAKSIKYGGMSETDALRTITLNGAEQLGLAKRLGSIEVGKDADLAVFNGHPLNSYSRVEMTLVEGEVYFQRGGGPRPFKPAESSPAKPVAKVQPLPRGADHPFLTGATVHPASEPPIT